MRDSFSRPALSSLPFNTARFLSSWESLDPSSPDNTHVSRDYMAWSRRSPSMRNQSRTEEYPRHRPGGRQQAPDQVENLQEAEIFGSHKRRPHSPSPPSHCRSEGKFRHHRGSGGGLHRRPSGRGQPRSSDRSQDKQGREPLPSITTQSAQHQNKSKRTRPWPEGGPSSPNEPITHPHKFRRVRSPSPIPSERELLSPRQPSHHRRHPHPRRRHPDIRPQSPSSAASFTRSGQRSGPVAGRANSQSRRGRGRPRAPSPSRPLSPARPRRYRSRRSRSPRQRQSPPYLSRHRRRSISRQNRDPPSPFRPRSSVAQSPTGIGDWDMEMHSTQRIQSIMDDPNRPPSPSRPNSHFPRNKHDPMGGRSSWRGGHSQSHGTPYQHHPHPYPHHRPSRPPPVDTHQHSFVGSPSFVTPASSYHGSPQSGSPFSGGRGGWGNQPQFHASHL